MLRLLSAIERAPLELVFNFNPLTNGPCQLLRFSDTHGSAGLPCPGEVVFTEGAGEGCAGAYQDGLVSGEDRRTKRGQYRFGGAK